MDAATIQPRSDDTTDTPAASDPEQLIEKQLIEKGQVGEELLQEELLVEEVSIDGMCGVY